jgi:hypothetical protein
MTLPFGPDTAATPFMLEVLTAARRSTAIFQAANPHLVGRCQHSGTTSTSIFSIEVTLKMGGKFLQAPEDGGSMFLLNVGIYLQVYSITTQQTNIDMRYQFLLCTTTYLRFFGKKVNYKKYTLENSVHFLLAVNI